MYDEMRIMCENIFFCIFFVKMCAILYFNIYAYLIGFLKY